MNPPGNTAPAARHAAHEDARMEDQLTALTPAGRATSVQYAALLLLRDERSAPHRRPDRLGQATDQDGRQLDGHLDQPQQRHAGSILRPLNETACCAGPWMVNVSDWMANWLIIIERLMSAARDPPRPACAPIKVALSFSHKQ